MDIHISTSLPVHPASRRKLHASPAPALFIAASSKHRAAASLQMQLKPI